MTNRHLFGENVESYEFVNESQASLFHEIGLLASEIERIVASINFECLVRDEEGYVVAEDQPWVPGCELEYRATVFFV